MNLELVPIEKKPRVVLVHGIHAKEGTSHIRQLKPYFEARGFEVLVFEYGWVSVLGARWRNPDIAWRLADVVQPDDHVVCHSNGAAVAWLAMKNHNMRCTMLSLIAPALDDDKWLRNATWTDVYHNHCDNVVWFARLLWWHSWGSMGRDGCTDPLASAFGVRNIDVAGHAGLPIICGHLAYFEPHILSTFGPFIAERHARKL